LGLCYFIGFLFQEEVAESILKHINDKVTDFKKIRGGILFRDSLPSNTAGKLLRRKMREWAKEQIDEKTT